VCAHMNVGLLVVKGTIKHSG